MSKFITILSVLVINAYFINQSIAFFGWYEKESKPVAVIVNSKLYPQIKDSIDRYLEDLKNEDYEVIFLLWDYKQHPNVEELKELLKGYHETQNLQGAVLIGKIPYAEGKMNGGSGPVETYLMDLYSANFIKNDEGIITNFQGHIYMDIWVSRICAQDNRQLFPNESEADLINRYFEKNHLYRTCQSPVPDLKLKFSANTEIADWLYDPVYMIIEYVNSNEHGYDYISTSGSAYEYLEFISANVAQYLVLKAHSEKTKHHFAEDGRVSYGLKELSSGSVLRVKQPFVFLEACSASDFSHRNSLGKAYLFGENSDVLVIAGLTVPGNMIVGNSAVHSTGEAFGVNFLNHIQQHDVGSWFARSFVGPMSVMLLPFISEDIGTVMTSQCIGILVNLASNYFGLFDNNQVGYTLLGDPTLKPYVDMDWCPEYRETK